MKKILLGALLAMGYPMASHAIEIVDNDRQMSIFNTYCMASDAYNTASELVAEGWISDEDSDLIEEEEYRVLLEQYAGYLNYGDTTIYTREYQDGAAFVAIDIPQSICSVLPMYDVSEEYILTKLKEGNINPMKVYESPLDGDVKKGTASFYLFGNTVINIIISNTDEGKLYNIVATNLDKDFSDQLRAKIEEKKRQNQNQ